MIKTTKCIFYGLTILTLTYCLIPFFRVDLRPNPEAEHIYVFCSLFMLGFPRYTLDVFRSIIHYVPIVFLVVLLIPFINKKMIISNILLCLSIIVCLVEIIWFKNRLPFGILLAFLVHIIIIYNVYIHLLNEQIKLWNLKTE